MEFAKNVPKPKAKPQNEGAQLNMQIDEEDLQMADHLFNGGLGSGKGITDRNRGNQVLQMLDQRH